MKPTITITTLILLLSFAYAEDFMEFYVLDQFPPDANQTNMINNGLHIITYINSSYLNTSIAPELNLMVVPSFDYDSSTDFDEICWQFIGGNESNCGFSSSGPYSADYANGLFNYSFYDNMVLPATYQYDEEFIESTTHTIALTGGANFYVGSILKNMTDSGRYNYMVFEIMANKTNNINQPLRLYYCNSSYSSGLIASSPYCANFYSLEANSTSPLDTPYNHCHVLEGNKSCHMVVPFSIDPDDMMIENVKLTNTGSFWARGGTGWTVYGVASTNGSDYYSTNNGGISITTTANSTIDMHMHLFTNESTLLYYQSAYDTAGEQHEAAQNIGSTTGETLYFLDKLDEYNTTEALLYIIPDIATLNFTLFGPFEVMEVNITWDDEIEDNAATVITLIEDLKLYENDTLNSSIQTYITNRSSELTTHDDSLAGVVLSLGDYYLLNDSISCGVVYDSDGQYYQVFDPFENLTRTPLPLQGFGMTIEMGYDPEETNITCDIYYEFGHSQVSAIRPVNPLNTMSFMAVVVGNDNTTRGNLTAYALNLSMRTASEETPEELIGVEEDPLEYGSRPPTSPAFILPEDNESVCDDVSIEWVESFSPAGYEIDKYKITLYDSDDMAVPGATYILDSTHISYSIDMTPYPIGLYYLTITVNDSLSQETTSYSNIFNFTNGVCSNVYMIISPDDDGDLVPTMFTAEMYFQAEDGETDTNFFCYYRIDSNPRQELEGSPANTSTTFTQLIVAPLGYHNLTFLCDNFMGDSGAVTRTFVSIEGDNMIMWLYLIFITLILLLLYTTFKMITTKTFSFLPCLITLACSFILLFIYVHNQTNTYDEDTYSFLFLVLGTLTLLIQPLVVVLHMLFFGVKSAE